MHPTAKRCTVLLVALVLACAHAERAAKASVLNLFFDASDSGRVFTIPEREVIEAAANWWERTLTEPVTRNVRLRWVDLGSSSGPARTIRIGAPEFEIQLNRSLVFFVDSTPALNEEYSLQAGSVYALTDMGANPNAAEIDLYSVVLHQFGHTLGIFTSFPAYVAAIEFPAPATDDDAPMANPPHIDTASGPVFLKGNGVFDPPEDSDVALELITVSDVNHPNDLMNYLLPAGSRRTISDLDTAVIESALGWVLNHPLQPQTMPGAGYWDASSTWQSGQVPDFNDLAQVSVGSTVTIRNSIPELWAVGNAGAMLIDGGKTVTVVGGVSNGNAGTIQIGSGATLAVNGSWSSTGSVVLQSGTVTSFDLLNTGTILGEGTVDSRLTNTVGATIAAQNIGPGMGNQLVLAHGIDGVNSGTLSTDAGTTLTLAGDVEGPFELLSNAGTLEVRPGVTVTFTGSGLLQGTYDIGGELNLWTPVGIFRLAGNLGGSGMLRLLDGNFSLGSITVNPVLQVDPPAVVSVAAGATLNLAGGGNNGGAIELSGGTLAGASIHQPTGLIVGDGTISAAVDGSTDAKVHGEKSGGEPNGCEIMAEGGDITFANGTTITDCHLVSMDGSRFRVPSGNTATLVRGFTDSLPQTAEVLVYSSVGPAVLGLQGEVTNDGRIRLVHQSGGYWSWLAIASGQTAILGGTGEVVVEGPYLSTIYCNNGATLTIGPDQLVHGSTNVGYYAVYLGASTTLIVNQGTIQADGSKDRLEIRGTGRLRNEGLLVAENKPLHMLSGTLENLTTVAAHNGQTVRLGVGTTLIGLGTLQTEGGIFELGSVYDNTGRIFTADAATTGDVRFIGAQITGGTLACSGGAVFNARESTSRLTSLTLARGCEIMVDPETYESGAVLGLQGEVTNDGRIRLVYQSGSYWSQLAIASGQTAILGGTGEVVVEGPYLSTVYCNNGATLTIGPDQLVHGSTNVGYYAVYLGASTTLIVNRGTIQADGSKDRLEIRGTGRLRNEGLLVAENKPLYMLSGTLENLGTIAAHNGQTLQVESAVSLTHLSSGTLTGGRWRALQNGILRLINKPITTNAAEIVLDGPNSAIYRDTGTTSALSGFVTNALGGRFVIDNGRNFTTGGAFTNAGWLTVGKGSTFTAAGNFTQTVSGTLNIELGGRAAGTDHGQLAITGTAALDGVLSIEIVDGYVPTAGDSFVVLTFAARTGDFAFTEGLNLGNGLALEPAYTDTSLTLTVVSELPSDFDGDGNTWLDDLEVILDVLAGPGDAPMPTLPGISPAACLAAFDADADGDIDLADYSAYQSAFTGPVYLDAWARRLQPGEAGSGSYFSNGNTLYGVVGQARHDPSELTVQWSLVSQPPGSGPVLIFDPSQLSSEFVIGAPALAGEYAFQLEVTNTETQDRVASECTLIMANR